MRRLVYCAALAYLAALAHAQTTPAPKPPPELKQLDYFAGKWSCEGVNKLTNVKSCVYDAVRVVQGWFRPRMPRHTPPPRTNAKVSRFTASALWKRRTRRTAIAVPVPTSSVFKGQRTGTTWTYTREGTFEGKPAKYHSVTNEASASKFSTQVRRAVEGGPWTVIQ